MRIRPYEVLYMDPSRIRRTKVQKNSRLAGRDLRLTCVKLPSALSTLKRDEETLDGLVIYAFGWADQEALLRRCAQTAKKRGIPVIYVAGNTTVAGLDLKREWHRECITYENLLDLLEKVKDILDGQPGKSLAS